VLSLIFVVIGYLGPGMIKSYITLRTGNAWVHALGYHIVAPHMVIDTPLIARVRHPSWWDLRWKRTAWAPTTNSFRR
ncbi:MAG TPA: hypothetical protein VFE60_08510, partial [Roseiarcus sp.]|nr:hypothetical protein [Roseiarcus sp.]